MTKARTLGNLASAGALDYIGTVKSLVAGTGLTGGTITTTGTIGLANTTVTAGSYTAANITIDAQGRITSASNGASTSAATYNTLGTVHGYTETASYYRVQLGANTSAIPTSSPNGIAIGQASISTTCTGGIVIGAASLPGNSYSTIVIGHNASVPNSSTYQSVVIGGTAQITANNTVALGYASKAQSTRATAIGAAAEATGYGSVSLGYYAKALSSQYAISIGHFSTASGTDSISIGRSTSATAGYTVAIGSGNTLSGSYSIGIGYGIQDQGWNAIVLNATSNTITAPGEGFYVKPITSGTTSNQLYYDTSSGKITYGAGGGSNLDALSDVVLTSPTTGQVLQYDGTNWVNATVSTGGTTEETTVTTATIIAPIYVNQFSSNYVRIGTDSPAKATQIKDAIVAAASAASAAGQQATINIIYNNTIFNLSVDSNASSYVTIFNSDAVNIQNYQVSSFSQSDGRPAGVYVSLTPSQYNQIAAKTLSFTFMGGASTLGTAFTTNKPYGVYYSPSNYGQSVGSLGPTTSPSTTPEIINVVATGQTLDVIFANNVGTITGVPGQSSPVITFVLGMTTTATSGGGGGATEAAVTVETPSNFNGQFTAQPNTTGSRGYVFANCWDGNLNSFSSNSPPNWGVVQGSTQWLYSQAANPTTGASISWDPVWYGNFTAVKIQGVDGGGVNAPNRHAIYQQTIYGYNNSIYWPPQQNWSQNYQMYSGGVAAYAVILTANSGPLSSWMQSVAVNASYTNMVDITIGTTGPIAAVGNTDFKYMVLRVKPEAFNSGNLGNAPLFTFNPPPNDVPINWVIAGKQ